MILLEQDWKEKFNLEYTYFRNTFLVTSHTWLTVIFYCWCKYIIAKRVSLNTHYIEKHSKEFFYVCFASFTKFLRDVQLFCAENYHFDLNFMQSFGPPQGLPPLSKHMLRVGRLANSDDSYSYAGGSVRSWQGYPGQTGQSVGARLSVVHWSFRLGVGRGANNSAP
jgi:hypothetical protein